MVLTNDADCVGVTQEPGERRSGERLQQARTDVAEADAEARTVRARGSQYK